MTYIFDKKQVPTASYAITASYALNAGGTPGGSDTYIQFNSASKFSGSSDLKWNYESNTLDISGSVIVTGSITVEDNNIYSNKFYIKNPSFQYPINPVQIPVPITFSGKSYGGTGSVALIDYVPNEWSTEHIKLKYHTNDLNFLNYNPKYFLFVFKSIAKNTKEIGLPAIREHNRFVHPANFNVSSWTGPGSLTITPDPTYTNFSNKSLDWNVYITSSLGDNFRSEWSVAPNPGQETILENFSPLRFYASKSTPGTPTLGDPLYIGRPFFPHPYSHSGSLSVITCRNYKKFGNPIIPRINLYVKFAIVIQNPNNINSYIIGPYSNTIRIYPTIKLFDAGGLTPEPYYYAWRIKTV